LSAPRSVEPGIAQVVLAVTSWHGDAAWSEQVRAAFEKAKAPAVRRRFLSVLTLFKDPALVRSGLDYLLTDAVRPTELLSSVRAAGDEDVARAYFDWVVERYDRLKQRLPEDQLPFLTSVVAGGDSELLERARAFFLDASRFKSLTKLEFEKVAEQVRLRGALRERYQAAVRQFVAERTLDRR
jgi:hypothetical protein